jgi:hypothetical protein
MKLLCPVCGKEVAPGAKTCPTCREPADVYSLWKRLVNSFKFGFNRATAVRCPACGQPGSLKFGCCLRCGSDFSVAAALAPLLRKPRKKWDDLVTHATPGTKRCFQLGYVLLSAILFWLSLGYSEKRHGTEWYLFAALSIVYVAFFTVFFFFLIPRSALVLFTKRTSRLSKLGLLFNYFTLLLFLNTALVTWKQRAYMLATLFGVSYIAFYIFLVWLYPVWTAMGSFFVEPDHAFDPTANQGRRARRDG